MLSLVIDLGGTHLRTAVFDETRGLQGRLQERTAVEKGPDGVIDQIVRMSGRSIEASDLGRQEVERFTVASPGPLDATAGVVINPPNMPGWLDVPLQRKLEDALQIPGRAVNDANAAALGELHFGSGRGHRNLVYLTVSTGIGAGIVDNGQLLEGVMGMAGEVGHSTIDRHGPLCPCGNIGCLEVIASGTSIARRFNTELRAGRGSLATDWLQGRRATAEDVTRAAQAGDSLALEIFTDAAEAVGNGVVNCIHIFNPEVIAIGGGVTSAGDLFWGPMVRIVDRYAMKVQREEVQIKPPELGHDVGLVGAAAVCLFAFEPKRSPATR